MTLDEAIKVEETIVKDNERYVNLTRSNYAMPGTDKRKKEEKRVGECEEVIEEHRQLAEWLRELIHLRNITEYIRDMVTCFEFVDSMHYNEDIIEWAESELRVDMREVNTDEDNNT